MDFKCLIFAACIYTKPLQIAGGMLTCAIYITESVNCWEKRVNNKNLKVSTELKESKQIAVGADQVYCIRCGRVKCLIELSNRDVYFPSNLKDPKQIVTEGLY